MAPERDGQGQPFARHLEEEQIRQLLDVVAVAHPIVAEDVAVVPELLNDRRRTHYAGPLVGFRFFHSASDQSYHPGR